MRNSDHVKSSYFHVIIALKCNCSTIDIPSLPRPQFTVEQICHIFIWHYGHQPFAYNYQFSLNLWIP